MISEFKKKLIVSCIQEYVVNRAYDFVEKSGIGEELVGKEAELCHLFKDFAVTAYITGAREQKEEIFKKLMDK